MERDGPANRVHVPIAAGHAAHSTFHARNYSGHLIKMNCDAF